VEILLRNPILEPFSNPVRLAAPHHPHSPALK
jgi:hypothetical protein